MDPEYYSSPLRRMLADPRPAWATALLVFAVYLPTLALMIYTGQTDILTSPRSRSILTSPTVIAYILIIGPTLARMLPMVICSLRPVILVEDRALESQVRRDASIPPLQEVAAIATGLVFGFLIIEGEPGPGERWPIYVENATAYVMFGLLGWLGLSSLVTTRVINHLLRLPMHIDPLDITPFEAIGRQSLAIALAFVGGNCIALLVGNYGTAALANPRFWLLFGPLFLFPAAVFFLNMVPTQRVLSRAKKQELAAVRGELHAAFRLLLQRRQAGEPGGSLSQEVNALAAYEQRLNEASSWPYNPAILRALIFSVLVQFAAVLARRVFEIYIR